MIRVSVGDAEKINVNVNENNGIPVIMPETKKLVKYVEGLSPIVEISEIEGGHRIVIRDINGEHSFDVLDGKTEMTEDVLERIINDYLEVHPISPEDSEAREQIKEIGTDLTDLKTRVRDVETEVGNASILLGLI